MVAKPEFDDFSEEYTFWAERRRQPAFRAILDFMPQAVARALDAGCGPGILSLRLADRASHLVGIDQSASMISLAGQRQMSERKNNADFLVADLEHLPFAPESFDFVFSNNALHYTSLDRALPRLRQLMTPGGRMAIVDLVSRTPRLDASPTWQRLRALSIVPVYLIVGNFSTMRRVLRFRLSRAWIRHVCHDPKPSPEAFRDIYSRFFPGCRFKDYGFMMAVFWEAPREPPNGQ